MSASISIVGRARLILFLLAVLLLPRTGGGSSIWYAKFSAPILQKDRLIFTSPDSKRLLCVGLNGEKLWERTWESKIRLFAGPEGEPLLQTGRQISDIAPQSGALRPRFMAEEMNDVVSYSQTLESFVSDDGRFEKRTFKLLDKDTGSPLWRTGEIEKVVCATPDVIVAGNIKRILGGQGGAYGNRSLEAVDRHTFKKIWSLPLPANVGIPFGSASFKSPYLIYVDGERTLAVVDITTGRKLLTKEMTLGKYSRISDVKISGDQVVWLTSKMNRVNADWSEHILHYCTIPELVEQKILVLQLLDIARVSFEGEFIISDSFYSTAGFRPDGQKVWKLFQNAHGPVIENRLYFSDSHFETARQTARLGFVDVPTGKETILYHESIKMEP